MITLNRLNKYFFKNKKNEIHVLDNISLSLPQNGLVVLLGPSGSGKTTLLNVIGGLDKVDQGSIRFDNQDINRYRTNVWDDIRNKKVGYVFQNYNLLPTLSVYDNIAFVLKLLGVTDKDKIDQNVSYILQSVGMYKYRKKKATQLSGGQQQRVAIARALVKNPEIVIADEPTGNLDSRNTFDIMKIIKEISKTKLVVLVTHEKDLAYIYADRIIELKDGRIISDEVNTANNDYNHIDENIVYLKDMHNTYSHQDETLKFDVFQDQNDTTEPINVRLIVKNKTLYVDLGSEYTKIKLLDKNSNLIIRDEHYKKLDKEELTETSFEHKKLFIHDEDKTNSKLLVSFKQIFQIALQKVLNTSVKGKLLLFSFIFSGIIVAIAMSLVAHFIVPDSSNMRYGDDYIILVDENNNYDYPTYSELSALLGENDYINTGDYATFKIVDQQTHDSFTTIKGYLDLFEHSDQYRLLYGGRGTGDHEIVITKAIADDLFSAGFYGDTSGLGQQYGIWNVEDLLYETLSFNYIDYTIAGIVDSDQSVIYTSETTLNYISGVTYGTSANGTYTIRSNGYLTTEDLLYGTLSDDDFVISEEVYTTLITLGTISASDTFPMTVDGMELPISGVVDDIQTSYTVYAPNAFVEEDRYQTTFETTTTYYWYYESIYIYSSDTTTLISNLEDNLNLTPYTETDYAIIQDLGDLFNGVFIPLIIIIFATAFLGFYFLMRSSMISRIYEISVYRSLGMKKRELIISYLVETTLIATATTILGYVAASIFLYRVAEVASGYSPFVVTPLTILLGALVVYVLNVGGGILPIIGLLHKTPSEISAKYDI